MHIDASRLKTVKQIGPPFGRPCRLTHKSVYCNEALLILASFVFLRTLSAYTLYTGTRYYTLIWLQMIKADPNISHIKDYISF